MKSYDSRQCKNDRPARLASRSIGHELDDTAGHGPRAKSRFYILCDTTLFTLSQIALPNLTTHSHWSQREDFSGHQYFPSISTAHSCKFANEHHHIAVVITPALLAR